MYAIIDIIADYREGLVLFINGFVNDICTAEELPTRMSPPEEPVESAEEPEVSPAIPEAPAVPATKAVVQPTICGDVNGDGSIDIEDAGLVRDYVNNFEGVSWTEF